MKNKKLLNKLINQAVKSCFKNGQLSEEKVESFVSTFKKLPNALAIQALNLFAKRLKIEIAKITLEISSSSALSRSEQDEVFKDFQRDYPITRTVNLVEPNLIAGIRVRIFDSIVDLSLNNRIKQIGDLING